MKFKRTKKYQSGGINLFRQPGVIPIVKHPLQFLTKKKSDPANTMSSLSGGDAEIEGLPSELAKRDAKIAELLEQSKKFNELDILSQTPEYKQWLKEMNYYNSNTFFQTLKNNLDNFKKFVEESKDKASEYVTYRGKVAALGKKGDLTFVPVDEVASGNYIPLTVGEVARLRRTNPKFAFRDDIFEAIKSTSSRKEILEQLQNSLKNLGSEYTEVFYQGQNAVNSAIQAASGDISKYKSIIGNNNAALAYAKYLQTYLTEDQKTQLKLAAIERGARTPEEIQTGMSMMLNTPYELARVTKSTTMIGTTDSSGGSGASKQEDYGSYAVAAANPYRSTIRIDLGGLPLELKGSTIDNWKTKGDPYSLMGNRPLAAAGNIENAYDINGNRLADKFDGKLQVHGMIRPDSTPTYVILPVDSDGKPILNRDKMEKVKEFQRIATDPKYANNPEQGILEARRKTGLNGVAMKPFISVNMLGPASASFNNDPSLKEASDTEKEMYESANEGYTMEPWFGLNDTVYRYIALIPAKDNQSFMAADQIISTGYATTKGNPINIGDFKQTDINWITETVDD